MPVLLAFIFASFYQQLPYTASWWIATDRQAEFWRSYSIVHNFPSEPTTGTRKGVQVILYPLFFIYEEASDSVELNAVLQVLAEEREERIDRNYLEVVKEAIKELLDCLLPSLIQFAHQSGRTWCRRPVVAQALQCLLWNEILQTGMESWSHC